MDLLLDSRLDVWHPLAVHFPVVLLMLGGVASLAWAWGGRAFWRDACLWLYGLGTLGALAAYLTGETMEEQIGPSDAVELHETLGLWTLVVAGLALLAHGFAAWRSLRGEEVRAGRALRWIAAALGLAAAVLVTATGHLGGAMVWGNAH
jgi:uncharacterized membrane protein